MVFTQAKKHCEDGFSFSRSTRMELATSTDNDSVIKCLSVLGSSLLSTSNNVLSFSGPEGGRQDRI